MPVLTVVAVKATPPWVRAALLERLGESYRNPRAAQSAASTSDITVPSATVLPMARSTGVAESARHPKVMKVEALQRAIDRQEEACR